MYRSLSKGLPGNHQNRQPVLFLYSGTGRVTVNGVNSNNFYNKIMVTSEYDLQDLTK